VLGWSLACWVGGWKSFGRAALAVAVGALLTLTVRASLTASFVNDDTPVEMLVYVQSSPQIVELRDRIDALAKESGLGRNLTVVVDGTDGYAWPWAWYLRDYYGLQYINGLTPQYEPPPGSVLLIHRSNAGNFNAAGYSAVPYKHRWWFCESYRDTSGSCRVDKEMSPRELLGKLTSWDSLKSLGSFFLYRRPVESGSASVDAVAYFPDSLEAFDAGQVAAPEPATLADGRMVIGRAGSGRGELVRPADVFVDQQGNIWVADSGNNRVQRFDKDGRFVTSVTAGGASALALREPWSLAVDADGYVYVADTWQHRIVKLSPQLDYVTSWGGPALGTAPSLLELYGPRDIVLAENGTLWVTDTGNKRLINFTKDGEPVGVFGQEGSEPGQFREPVGLARGPDGSIYVADAWNGRIQRFGPGFASPMAIATGWTSEDILAKPYLAVLSDGRLIASDPAKGQLLLFDAEGRLAGTWPPETGSRPLGVAALPDGGFVFSDVGRNELQVVPRALIATLFR
jgi:DNA-binding beta-propeller fold protein YncE